MSVYVPQPKQAQPVPGKTRVMWVASNKQKIHMAERGVTQGDLTEKAGRYAACGTRPTYAKITDDPSCVTCAKCRRIWKLPSL